MNQSELNSRTLTDYSFIFQDYELCASNIKAPLNEFKSMKAYKHAASCQELLMIANVMSDPAFIHTKEFTN
jgi:hypothetical protein